MNKILGILMLVAVLVGTIVWIWTGIYAGYQWKNEVLSNWNLADKASTIEAKAIYIDKFVSALRSSNLADNNALIYKTADNNCQNNIDAVATLKTRLDEIKTIDITSFQYQQAIQQITAQEQGEASELISTLHGCWLKTNHYFLWNGWLQTLYMVLIALGTFLGVALIASHNNNNRRYY